MSAEQEQTMLTSIAEEPELSSEQPESPEPEITEDQSDIAAQDNAVSEQPESPEPELTEEDAAQDNAELSESAAPEQTPEESADPELTPEAAEGGEESEQPVDFDDLFPAEDEPAADEPVATERAQGGQQAAGSAEKPEWLQAREAEESARAKAADVDGAKATEVVPAANALVAEDAVMLDDLDDLDWLNQEDEENYTFEDLFPEVEEELALEDGKAPALALQDDGAGGESDTQQEPEVRKNAFEEGLDRLKRKRPAGEMTAQEAEEKMEDLICKMSTAADEDCEIIKKNMAKERLRKMVHKDWLASRQKVMIINEKTGKEVQDGNKYHIFLQKKENMTRFQKLYKHADFPNGKDAIKSYFGGEDNKFDRKKAREGTTKLLDEHPEQPALQKVSILRSCVKEIGKPESMNWFVTFGGLAVIKSWLEPAPDGSLPALTLRNELLSLIPKLPVSSSNLRKSKLGHAVKTLLGRADETLTNRKKCQDLITRWLGQVLEVKNSIRNERVEMQDKLAHKATPAKKRRMTKEQQEAHEKEVQERRHPQMFQKPSHNFKVAPQYEVHSLHSAKNDARQTRKGKVGKVAGELRALKPASRHENVSIANFQMQFS